MIISILLLYMLIRSEDEIERYIYTLTSWMTICVALVEGLSAFNAITTPNLWIAWLIIIVCLGCGNLWRGINRKNQNLIKTVRNFEKRHILVFLFCTLVLIIALMTVPYNWDSMTYHLSRLEHWMRNCSVGYYATHIDRQVSSPLGGAYVNLIVYVMTSGSDLFLNLLQSCSFLFDGLLVYSLAKKLGVTRNYCYLSTLLYFSMPIAFAEAFSTQVDNFATLWMLSTIYLLMDFLKSDGRITFKKDTVVKIIGLSLCVAFGYLSKPSIGFGLLIFAIWLLGVVIKRRDNFKVIISYLGFSALIVSLVLFPHFYRNIVTFDALSPPNVGSRQLIGTLNPVEMFVNFTKNISFNMPSIWLYGSRTGAYVTVKKIAQILGVNIDNPAISEDGREFVVHLPQTYSHDCATNPVILYLFLICVVLFLLKNRNKKKAEFINAYFGAVSISFIVFCSALRWEAFVSRYMSGYLALLCPAIVAQIELFFKDVEPQNYEYAFKGIIYFVCLSEMLGLFMYHGAIAVNDTRNAGYFYYKNEMMEAYTDVAEYVTSNGYREVGLLLDNDAFEYPLLVMLDKCERIESVNVDNATNIFEDESFIPDIIVAIDWDNIEDEYVCHGQRYVLAEKLGTEINIFEKSSEN